MAATATSKSRLVHGEPVRLAGDRLLGSQQRQDGLQGLLHPPTLIDRVDAHDEGVARQCTGAGAEHDPPSSQVVEQHHAVGD
jgi:hypothetical protein